MKKSEQLAIENAQRIAHQLRSERNDALALAQVRREQLEKAKKLLIEAQGQLRGSASPLAGPIDQFLSELDI